jgi:aldehyde dehydrogenase (NAD+)
MPDTSPAPPYVFDLAEAERLNASLRGTFRAGRTRDRAWREGQLRAMAKMLSEHEEDFLDALRADLRKPTFEAYAAEIRFMAMDIEHLLEHLADWMEPERVAAPLFNQPAAAWIEPQPKGVALIIAPWNYPLQLLLSPLAGALAAGCCAVIKPSELAPHTAAAVAKWVPQYLDRDAVRVVQGAVEETTALLAQRWDHIFFTGGEQVGKVVMRAAAEHLTPVTLELGGKSPCYVDPSAKLDVAARRIVWGKFYNAGQTCIAPDYLLLHRDIEQPFIERLKATIAEFFGENPQQSADLARIINERHHARLVGLLADAEIVVGGQHDVTDRYIAPTLVRAALDAPIMREEIFGPILPILTVDSLDAAITFIGDRPRPLALYAFAQRGEVKRRVLAETTSGGVSINDTISHIACPDLPFGGVGPSGMGAYHGKDSFDTFTHRKSVCDRATWIDPSLRYPPYSDTKRKLVSLVM